MSARSSSTHWTDSAPRFDPSIASVGVNSWAVDYGIVRNELLVDEPFHYRDQRCQRGAELVHDRMTFTELFARNGLQYLPFNTLYQLAVDAETGRITAGDHILLIPDLIVYWLTGVRVSEYTNSTTTGLIDARTRDWDEHLIDTVGLHTTLLADVVAPGTIVGSASPHRTKRLGASRLDVVTVASHDTASGVVATPMTTANSAYISCGTWGLVGIEIDEPVLTDAARDAGFTNEGGVDGTIRLLGV